MNLSRNVNLMKSKSSPWKMRTEDSGRSLMREIFMRSPNHIIWQLQQNPKAQRTTKSPVDEALSSNKESVVVPLATSNYMTLITSLSKGQRQRRMSLILFINWRVVYLSQIKRRWKEFVQDSWSRRLSRNSVVTGRNFLMSLKLYWAFSLSMFPVKLEVLDHSNIKEKSLR